MADVFVSYSHDDQEFVRYLQQILESAGKEAWIDWHSIVPTEQWWQAILRGIESANNFVFVLSPKSLASEYCRQELLHAASNNKRLVPLLRRAVISEDWRPYLEGSETEEQQALKLLHDTQYIPFRETDDVDQASQTFLRWLDTTPEWANQHTRLLQRAAEWSSENRNVSYTLRGDDLKKARRWLSEAANQEPRPTSLHLEYIRASQRAARARRRISVGGIVLAVLVTGSLGIFAINQFRGRLTEAAGRSVESEARATQQARADAEATAAAEQEAIAGERTFIARSQELAANALIAYGNAEYPTAYAQAVEAYLTYPTPEAERALFQVIAVPLPRTPPEGLYSTSTRFQDLSPDGQRIVTATDFGLGNTAQVSDANSGEMLLELIGHFNKLRTVAFSPDGTRILTSSSDYSCETSCDFSARIWDARTGLERRALLHNGPVVWAEFSPDGQFVVTVSNYDRLAIWDADTGQVAREYTDESKFLTFAHFSPDGTRLITDSDSGAALWDATTLEYLATLINPSGTGSVEDASFQTNGGTIAGIVWPNQVFVWVSHGTLLSGFMVDSVDDAVFDPTGDYLLTGDGEAQMWHVQDSNQLDVITKDPDQYCDLCTFSTTLDSARAMFTQDGKHIVIGREYFSHVEMWDIEHGTGLSLPWANDGDLRGRWLSVTAEGIFAITGDSDYTDCRLSLCPTTLSVWDLETGNLRAVLDNPAAVVSASISRDGSRIVAAGYYDDMDSFTTRQVARVWDLATGQLVSTLGDDDAYIFGVIKTAALTPDGQRAVIVNGLDEVSLIDVDSQENLSERLYTYSLSGTGDMEMSPDGTRIAVAGFGDVQIVNSETGELLLALDNHQDGISRFSFSPNGDLLVTSGSDGTAVLWDAVHGAPVHVLTGHAGTVRSAQFSSDATRLVTSGSDGTIRLWSVESGALLGTLRGHNGEVLDAVFSPDDSRIVSVGADRTLRIWPGNTQEVLQIAMRRMEDAGLEIPTP